MGDLIHIIIFSFLSSFFYAYMETLPLVIGLFHVIYGRGRWGWFIFSIVIFVLAAIGGWTNLQKDPDFQRTLMFILEQGMTILFFLFYYRLIKLELRKREDAETDPKR